MAAPEIQSLTSLDDPSSLMVEVTDLTIEGDWRASSGADVEGDGREGFVFSHAMASEPETESEAKREEEHSDPKQGEDHGSSRLSDEVIPLAKLPNRPKPLLELGSPFLGTGNIGDGFHIWTGAVWQPSFMLFGSFRSGLSLYDDDRVRTAQWSNRLDLFGNLYLTGTERLVFGLRPMDETGEDGSRVFSGYTSFSPDPGDLGGSRNGFNFDFDSVTHLFFEGDFGELFPGLDPEEKKGLDFGFSVGRQPIVFQEGLLINDFIDSVGITRNSLRPKGTINLRVTGLFGWNQINRNTPSADAVIRNLEAESSRLVGIFTETDWRATTIAIDAVYVHGGTFRRTGLGQVQAGNGLYTGLSFVQRLGSVNTAFRLLGSIPVGDQTPEMNLLGVSDPSGGDRSFSAKSPGLPITPTT